MSAPTRRIVMGCSSRARAPSRSSRRTLGASSVWPPGAKIAPAGIEATARAGQREGRGVDREGQARRAEQEQHGAEARAGDDADLLDGRARGVGGGQVGVVDEARRGGRHGRDVDAGRGGRQGGDDRREGDGQAGRGDAGQGEHEDEADAVGGEHQPPAVVAVGDDAAERAEDDDGQDARGGGDGEPRGRMRALVDEGEEREVVEPVAGLRDGQAGEEAAEAGIAASNVHGCRVCA